MESVFIRKAREVVVEYYQKNGRRMAYNDTFVVWFSKTLQNWKTLISTTAHDDMYFEITYNGDQDELYVDVYEKKENIKWN